MSVAQKGAAVTINFNGWFNNLKPFAWGEEVCFEFGHNQVLDAVERAVRNMEVGETRRLFIPMYEAYGPRQDKLVQNLPWDHVLLTGIKDLKVGDVIRVPQDDGEFRYLHVINMTESGVLVDENSVLAGHDLNLDVTLVSVD